MPLVRIELSDFKSYRGHQTIGPFRNFTSVIGPNGAGKSNLMDAISFVLGVKSAQLRSSQLRDLIYRGRRLEKDSNAPSSLGDDDANDDDTGEGTANKAWVMAVYLDQTGKEWHFQRTIFLTGSSEYKLNDKVVTYAAYNAALISHNVLVKAKNFLVFQGDVEAVASQSPIQLTGLIEQISGSLELKAEYEKAKEAQDRATENATFNFTKRRGIAGEIKQYKEQKGEAERFNTLCQERDNAILRRIVYKLYCIEKSIETNVTRIKSENHKLASLRQQRKVHESDLAKSRAEQAKIRNAVLDMERRIKKAEKTLESKRPELVSTEAHITHSTRKVQKTQELSAQIEKDVKKKQELLDNLRRELASAEKAAANIQEEQRKMAEQNLSLGQSSLEEYRELKASAALLAVDERQSLETLTRDEKTTGRSLNQLREKHIALEKKREALQDDRRKENERNTELSEKIAELSASLASVKQELQNHQSERARITQLEAEANEKLESVMSQILQAGLDKNESDRDVKQKENLASLQRIFPGVRGRIVDLCKPTARKYETAVSVILGRNIDAIVVDEEKTAIDCIEYLRNQRAGQATFIPLDTIQVKPINDKFRSFAKGARLAVDCIQFENAVERAMHHACGNALVCDTIDVARYVCWEKNQEVKAVTLEGTIIHKSGLMTGGKSTHGSGKKWEEKEIQGLYRLRDALMGQLRELQKNKPRGKADESLISEIGRLEQALAVARDDQSVSERRLSGTADELKHLEREIKKSQSELTKLEKTYDKLVGQIQELSFVVNEAEDNVFEDFCRRIGVLNIREYENRQLKLAQSESETRLRYETQIARITNQISFEEEQLESIEERLSRCHSTIASEISVQRGLEADRERIQKQIQEDEAGIAQLQSRLAEVVTTREQADSAVDKAKSIMGKSSKALDQTLKEISTMNDGIQESGAERSALYRKCRLEEIKLPLNRGNLRHVPMDDSNLREQTAMDVDKAEDGTQSIENIEDYGIEVDFDILDEDEREASPTDALTEYDNSIVKLNAEIEKMAPNMKAIERLEDVEAKLIDTEKEADQARKESKKARDDFNDVKARRCELFNKAYNHISQRIDQIYKDLTKGKISRQGGVAYLSLEDSEEPYNGGIQYHAMPPMKQFRDMDQLSGGEKTVAALALLFAIHSYRPAPFFVLDEVDAALDNTNVAKIAQYIRDHASESFQFVVISLKNSLYERGESLVGIYRDQDVNSSRTLTLDLTQYDE